MPPSNANKGEICRSFPERKADASVLESGPVYDKAITFYKERGVMNAIREIVIVKVQSARPIDSPAYDVGLTEDVVRAPMDRVEIG